MGTGSEFVKKIRPMGCALFLAMFVMVTVLLFTARPEPEYVPPESGEYYALHLDELKEQIEEHVLPELEATGVTLSAGDTRILVTAPAGELEDVREGILKYFDGELFEFSEVTE